MVDRTLTAVPMPIRRVRPSSRAASVAAFGQTPYGTKWCSASQTLSSPARSAATVALTVRSSTSPWVWPGNWADSRKAPTRIASVADGCPPPRSVAGSGPAAAPLTAGGAAGGAVTCGSTGRTPIGGWASVRALVLVMGSLLGCAQGLRAPPCHLVSNPCHVPMAR